MVTEKTVIYIGRKKRKQFDPEQLIQFTPSDAGGDMIRYGYRSYDVDRTIGIENGLVVQIVAVTPLGFLTKALTDEETTGLLSYFGFESKTPCSVREQSHPYNLLRGTTRCYSQPVCTFSNVSFTLVGEHMFFYGQGGDHHAGRRHNS